MYIRYISITTINSIKSFRSMSFLTKLYLSFLCCILLMSCETQSKADSVKISAKNLEVNQMNYKTVSNSDNTLTLHYSVKEEITDPVRIFSYYVTDSSTKNTVKTLEKVAAEKIYWKDNNTIAIIPYKEVMQKEDDLNAPRIENELLIKIK